ncbi:hypothetical protein SanaruYs_24700 [Chryseotalea sanaruensis]|uniref:DUF4468 domain-containing protein n=1 Tax=Chryseotalea sanaruensis TaxID=2482724 RepID=A0A401UBK3_9BACT|nr:hypothetical protein [Chryseotalea sanaruensis]GCC52234.1 hypothetical protein SanaruYs_24700 [Chryseotalea sanaruensis]
MKHFLLIVLLTPFFSFSQGLSHADTKISDLLTIKNNLTAQSGGAPAYDGYPYNDESFIEATLVLNNEKAITDVPVRINLYNNTVEYRDKKQIFMVAEVSTIKEIRFDDKVYVNTLYTDEGEVHSGFFVKSLEGNPFTVLQKEVVVFEEAVRATNSYSESKNARFVKKKDKIYIKQLDKPAQLLKSKDDLYYIFKDYARLNEVLKKNKIKLNKVDEVINLVSIINADLGESK